MEVYGGLRAICLNTRAFSSNTLKSVYNPDKHDVMIGFEYTGTKWSISLRSDNDIDVSVIAKVRGGGGHTKAAGFEVNNFEDIFK
jgi:nanoRNase/pAp phosphatase (c-di-AMP/oligoRNAs hydrolase)